MAEYSARELLHAVNSTRIREGNPRVCVITARIVSDLFRTIEEFDVQTSEFMSAIKWLNAVGHSGQFGLVAPGLGFDRLLDILEDERARRTGNLHGTPRAIEGPLYVPDAPMAFGEARLDDGTDEGDLLIMEGRVLDARGTPIPASIVDVWHASPEGFYSHFHPKPAPYNYRRRIQTDAGGRYRFRSLRPSGYAVPPGSPTAVLLDLLGRHGRRPAHIHFMISAPGHPTLTTQINIPGDPYLDDDFAFATRDPLIVTLERVEDHPSIVAAGLDQPFTRIGFDFVLLPATEEELAPANARADASGS
jgi:catechol 1,2-dioxygenase